jgi:hypothetical protein
MTRRKPPAGLHRPRPDILNPLRCAICGRGIIDASGPIRVRYLRHAPASRLPLPWIETQERTA